jgi:hypothetical protein
VPRPGSGRGVDEILRGSSQPAVAKAEEEGAVEAFIRDDNERSGGIKNHRVWMRGGLLPRIRAGRSLQRDQLADRPQTSVVIEGYHRDDTGSVVRDHQEPFGGIEGKIDRVIAVAVSLIEQGQDPGLPVDSESADQVTAAVHAVKQGACAVQREERGVFQITYGLDEAPSAADRAGPIDIDAFPRPFRSGVV